ncbi:HD domain-containing phosphohydrolase [Paenibacillus bouchesdurhonensis]|uniref:HD domain-containing phosphohydrolase n=1 Tax=Paenibacillus bouchesdurhonensis TaxID=1870990 RepID=UPI002D218E84|nr:HD domain-containing phosphohydrolase [Paenibacillus bouchesdurhonensis]
MYKTFYSRLLLNYLAGSLVAALSVASLITFTLQNTANDEYVSMLAVMLLSIAMMLGLEWAVFKRQIRPIRLAFYESIDSFTSMQTIYLRTHRLPTLIVKRILGPHLLGLALPAASLTLWLIYTGQLSISPYYVLLALLGGVLLAGMHALIEFYLTSHYIRPVLEELRLRSLYLFGRELTLGGRVLFPIKRKLRWSFFLIGASPLLLYSLAVQLRLGDWNIDHYAYWKWAGIVLLLGLGYSFFASRLLTRELETPIQHLYRRMAGVRRGSLQTEASDLFSDEFSKLVSGFNHMLLGVRIQADRNDQLVESYFATLAAALDARDPYTAGHSLRVAEYAVQIGTLAKLPKPVVDQLRKAALLHDIGKIGIRDAVLLKEGQLGEQEWEQIKAHPVLGEAILRQIEPADEMAAFLPGVRSHHERYDGGGYPDGLKGEEIPLFGRIIAVADAFDAMTSDRPYRKGMAANTAIAILEKGRGTQWDPYFVALFVEAYYEKQTS